MKSIATIGLQCGDEGKGNVLSYFAQKFSEQGLTLIERFQGGANAGHTLHVNGIEYKVHAIPSGIVFPNTFSLIARQCLVNPRQLVKEMSQLSRKGVVFTPEMFGISSQAHVTLDHHVVASEKDLNIPDGAHTSTGRGIKETARDKADRVGIRFVEFLDHKVFVRVLSRMGFSPDDASLLSAKYDEERSLLRPYLANQVEVESRAFDFVLLEGAQGVMLDMDVGQYPGVTSSNPSLIPYPVDYRLGVLKLYTSNVGTGNRPFVGRFDQSLETRLAKEWREFGTTTHKQRELGPVDLVAVRMAAQASHVDYLVATCGDRLETFHQLGMKIPVLDAYEVDGKVFDSWDVSFDNRETLKRAKPIIREFDSWPTFSAGGVLHPNAQRFLEYVSARVGKGFALVSTGPGADEKVSVVDF